MKKYLTLSIVALLGITALMSFKLIHPADNSNQYPIDLKLTDVNGKVVSLSDYEGKTVVLNFWATWCPPCKAELPTIETYNANIKPENVEVLLVSLDRNFETAKNFMNKRQSDLQIFALAQQPPKEFVLSSIPVTYIIKPTGEISITIEGMTDFTSDFFLDEVAAAL